jgi:group I intron endonuclease
MIGIYKITSPTQKIYIGQSVDIEARFKVYKREFGIGQTKLFNSLKKYGVNRHIFEVVVECEVSQLNEMERYYQELYNCIKQGLNCNYVRTDNVSGRLSEETKLKMSAAQTGNKKWLGKKHTQETKEKMSKSMRGIKRSDEFRLAISNRKKGKPTGMISPSSKLVLNVVTGIFYQSLREASKTSHFNYNTLKSYLSGYKVNKSNFIYA